MIAALDVQYVDSEAHAAAVVFQNWDSEEAVQEYTVKLPVFCRLRTGEFLPSRVIPVAESDRGNSGESFRFVG